MATTADTAALLRRIPLSSPILEVWFNGIFLCLAVITLWTIVLKPIWGRLDVVSIAIILIMYTSATIHAGTCWWLEVYAFSNFGGTPAIVDVLVRNPIWYKAVGASAFALVILIADCLFIWRCHVIWKDWKIIVLPITATIAGTVLATISIVGQVLVARSRTPGVVPLNFVKYSTPYLILSCATTLYTTTMIVAKLVLSQREVKTSGTCSPHGRKNTKLVEIFVESAMIYSINLLVFVVLTTRKDINLSYPQNIHPQIAGIATAMIIFRRTVINLRDESVKSSPEYSLNSFSTILDRI